MGKSFFSFVPQAVALFLITALSLSAFEKLPSHYQISYGNPQAPIQITEYFSLSCPKCLEIFRKDFEDFRRNYIDSQKVHWIFHLNPADLLTLQAMVCLEKLSLEEKRIFLEVIIDTLEDPAKGSIAMQIAMETFGKPIPQLQELSYLEKTSSFQSAYKYLKQSDVIRELPTVEINGKVHKEFPNRKFIEHQLSILSIPRNHP